MLMGTLNPTHLLTHSLTRPHQLFFGLALAAVGHCRPNNNNNNNNKIYLAPYSRNFRGARRSQINENTIEPSLTGQDINPIAYMP